MQPSIEFLKSEVDAFRFATASELKMFGLLREPQNIPFTRQEEVRHLLENGNLAEDMLNRPLSFDTSSRFLMSLFKHEQESGQPAHDHDSSKRWHITFLPGDLNPHLKPLILYLCLFGVEQLLESIWRSSRTSKILEKSYPGLHCMLQTYTNLQMQSIQDQIACLEIPFDGVNAVLDPTVCVHVDRNHNGLVISSAAPLQTIWDSKRVSRGPVDHHFKPYDALLTWLFKTHKEKNLQKIPFRCSGFSQDPEGLLHESNGVATYLILQPENSEIIKNKLVVHQRELLLVAKLASTAEGFRKIQQEAHVLKCLQGTERVAKLWEVDSTEEHLRQKVLVVHYHPTPPPGTGSEDHLWKSLPEIKEILFQLLEALALLHDQGWIWLGLTKEHILINQYKMDPRDLTLPLRIIGFEDSLQIGRENKATLPLHVGAMSHSLQRKAPEWHPGAEIGTSIDLYAVGLLGKSYLHRDQANAWADHKGLTFEERTAIVTHFNTPVHDLTKRLESSNPLLDLLESLVQQDPESRPTARQALHKMSQLMTDLDQVDLNPQYERLDMIPGHLDTATGKFIYPCELETTVREDIRKRSRLTTYCRLRCAVNTRAGANLAIYSGRPVSKPFLMWLKYFKLHTHASNDGASMGWDGRRLCNGIFDQDFYLKTRKVVGLPFFVLYLKSPKLHFHNAQVASLIDSPSKGERANSHFAWFDAPMLPDAPGAPWMLRTTLVKATKAMEAHEPILVGYGRSYEESIFATLKTA